ncbi:MAG: cyclic nucleotide-binding domain-containing protein, partial [Sulfuricaulis sp.]
HYGEDKKFIVDAKLTRAFVNYNRQYLMAYLRNPDQGNFRLALIHRSQVEQPWGSYSLLLEKHIVRRLYPVGGKTTDLDLTTFQKKNREKSIYRGMELFLEYKDTSIPELPVYCPVLYDRNTALDDYASILDRQINSADRDTPVVEVINMLAAIPTSKRVAPEIGILKDKIYQGIVKKGMRKSAEFTLMEDVRRNALAGTGENVDPYADIDKRNDRQVTLNPRSTHGGAAGNDADGNALLKNIGAALVGRPQPADPMALKTFSRFRELSHEKLVALAAQSFVYKVPPGTLLLERGTVDVWNLYLLEGSLQLLAADGVEKNIDSGTDTASNPISSLKPRMYTVTTRSHVRFLWMDDRLVEKVIQSEPPPRRREGAV